MPKRNFYDVLGVPHDVGDAEIKKAYRQCALQYHPDRNPGDKGAEEKFKEAAEAYEVLADPEKRARYDRFGEAGLSGTGFHHFNDVDDIFASFGDIFQDFFGFSSSRRPRTGARRGRDLSLEMEIDFHEACFGVEKKIEVSKREKCEPCHGMGAKSGTSRKPCSTCRGSGQVGRSQGFFTIMTPCPTCQGEGSVITDPCPECHGQGSRNVRKKLTVKVPPGVDDGNRLVLQHEGDAGSEGGEVGDLYLFLRVRPHEDFERDGDTIYSEEAISFVTAALGGDVEVETLDGTTKIQVPRGTNTGDTVIVDGAGVPHLKSKKRGDHVVRLVVRVPKNLTAKQEELLKEFASLSGEATPAGKKKKGFFS